MDLGLERAGMECAWQVEIDPFCRRVLTKHWPNVPKYNDVREVGKHNLEPVDLIAGGFPCQDISNAGKGAGIDGEESGLWKQFARIVGELRPGLILVENVPALLDRGMGVVLGDLAALGFDAEWATMSACSLGAPHTRERLFIVAYPPQERWRWGRAVWSQPASLEISGRDSQSLRPWAVEPNFPRVAYGTPSRVDRVRSLGNAVVPQVAEWIGERIMEAEASPDLSLEIQDAESQVSVSALTGF